MAADGALIALLDDEGRLRFAHEAGRTAPRVRRWRTTIEGSAQAGGGLIRTAIATGRLQSTGNYTADDSFPHARRADRIVDEIGIRTLIAAPLLLEGRAIGVLTIYAERPDAFSERDIALARALADHAAASIGNARLIERLAASETQLARRVDIERALALGGARLATLHDPADVLQTAVQEAARLLDADGALLDLIDPATGVIRWAYDAGIRDERHRDILRNLELRLGEGMFGTAIADGTVLVTEDYLADPRFHHSEGADSFAREAGIASMIAAPLVGDAGPLGVLGVYSARSKAYGSEEAALAGSFAAQATIALTNARLIDELEASRAEVARRADAERTVREIGAQISALRDREDVVQLTVDEAVRLLDADGARIDLVSEAGLLRGIYSAGDDKPSEEEWPATPDETLDQGVSGMATTSGTSFRTDDYLADDRFRHGSGPDHYVMLKGIRSVLAAPLLADSGAIGAVSVWSTRPAAFGDRHESLLEALATQATIALTNARLIDELARSRGELEHAADTERALREIAARITAIRDPDEVLQRIVDEAQRLLGSDGAHLTFMAEERTHLVPVVAAGVDDDTRRWMLGLTFPLHGGINGLAAALRRPVTTDDYLVDPRFPHEQNDQHVAARLGLRGCASVPLRGAADEVIGTLAISYRTIHELGDDELGLLQVLADQASIAVTNGRLDALLRDSEARYRHLVENSPDLVWAIDANSRFTFLSETCERLTGWRPDELLGGHFGGLVHPSSQDVAEIDWSAGLANGSHELRGRVNLLHRDGHPIPAEFRAISQIEDGAFVGANGTVRDMSERDRLERELRASEERYRFLVENAPDIVFATDSVGQFSFMSEGIERVTGFTPEESVGRHFSFLVAEQSVENAVARWQALVDDPSRLQIVELELRGKDGSIVPVEVSAMGLVDPDGTFAGIHGATRDISERRRFERELRESEERYRYLVRASPDVVWAVDADGAITFMGDRITELTGWTPDEVIGQPFDSLTQPDVVPQAQETWEAVKRDPGYVYPLRIAMPRKSGDPIPVEIWVTGSVHEGRFVGAHGSIRDMRENERLVGDLRRQAADLAASDERAHLARELHDSVTQALFSMTLITRSVEVLLERDPAAAGEQLKTLRDLQKDALAEMRSLIFELRPSGLAEEGLVAALRRHAAAVQGRIGLPVVVEADLPDRPAVEVEDALYRIAQEALHNVVKHAGARTVRLSLEGRESDVRMAVVDDGSGFEAADVPPGHLGLAGMRARAEKIGGRLTVDSRRGRGTRIEVVVPHAT